MIGDFNVYEITKKEKWTIILILCLGLLAIGVLFFNRVVFVLLVIPFYPKAEKAYKDKMIRKRKKELLLQFKDLLYEFSSSFSSGRHMEEALYEAHEKLKPVYGEDSYIILEIDGILGRIKSGLTDYEAFSDFAARSKLSDIRDFAEVFKVSQETGGNLVSAINKSASLIGEKIIVEGEIETMLREKRAEGNIITAMPFIILGFLRISSPSYMTPVYETLLGRILMGVALILTIVAYKIIDKIVDIEI